MPIYEFICQKCKRLFEKFIMSSSESKKVDCPNCGSGNVEKKISTFSSSCGCNDTKATNQLRSTNLKRFG